MPNLNVGLLSTMWGQNATAVSAADPACANCYCCTNGTQFACKGTCYYDERCCMVMICPEGQIWDSEQGKCVDEPVVKFCMSGTYPTATSCKPCPETTDFSSTNARCSASSPGGTIGGSAGDTSISLGIESCYMPKEYLSLEGGGTCEYTDVSGTFEFTRNCNYSARIELE